MNRCQIAKSFVIVSILTVTAAQAEVRLPGFFGDNMVLQRDRQVPVWGWADKGQTVTVEFADQKVTVKAGDDGKWMLKLKPMPANAKAGALVVKGRKPAGRGQIEIKNVLVGDVWLCSGQSNMEWAPRLTAEDRAGGANLPLIRHIKLKQTFSADLKDDIAGRWTLCSVRSVTRGFSGAGYYFAKELHKELKVPIGLIGSNWGGTKIEPWIPAFAFKKSPELKKISDTLDAIDPKTVHKDRTPTRVFNAMINPLVPFAIRGTIWYQGEGNPGEDDIYFFKKKALISGWRELWGYEFPFYFVQLTNYGRGSGFAEVREGQRKSLAIPKTGMAVAIDIGVPRNIHAGNKQDVGKRLALWALAKEFGRKIVYSGPLYKGMKIEGGKIRISFDHIGSGLMVGRKIARGPTRELKGGKLKRFEIAGADKKWVAADAVIVGKTVVVSSDEVKNPLAVRYAFSQNPSGCNLYNKEGLPASPFRTGVEGVISNQ